MSDVKEMAEVEIKIELPAMIYKRIATILLQNGFTFESIEEQTDYYLNFEKNDDGYNFRRLRVIKGKQSVITEKKWKTQDGDKVRVESEYFISDDEKDSLILGDVAYIAKKCRVNYTGMYNGYDMHICEDTLFLNKSIKHLLECEILTNIEDAKNAKQIVLKWFSEILDMDELKISPSILELIMNDEKLI
jgi:adenylate cyclase class IV